MVLVALAHLPSSGEKVKSTSAKKKGRGDDPKNNVRTYFKVLATFQCSKDTCKKTWHSAHAWHRGDDGVYCEACEAPAELLNAMDEILKLDTYTCTHASCDNYWQSIHFQDGDHSQECDLCGTMVSPVGPPQERFGRHYFFRCRNKGCPLKPDWEDFSTAQQKTQRCTKCHSRGDIRKVQKLKPHWQVQREQKHIAMKRGSGGGDWINVSDKGSDGAISEKGSGKRIIGFGFGKGPSKHNKDFCDMCQDVIRQGVGRSCHQLKRVVCIVTQDTKEGNLLERIVQVSMKSG